ncbi:MAG: rhomboid family intramembrane serine protease [Anaerolineae bacterium]|nr:rhomboid family intramembrane serine protease [Anaerolineae bacterium]MDK1081136.1 rhomboid family intramembrane serine protease [Anaerolineae bacterium]
MTLTQPPEYNTTPSAPQTPPESSPPRAAPPARLPINLPAAVPRVTYVIIGVTVVAYLLQLLSQFLIGYDLLILLGAKSNEFIRSGQLWRFLTPMLLHGSLIHIGFNMYALTIFGTNLERRYGHGRYILLYLLGGFAGSVFSFLFTEANSIGASGAVFGLIGAEGIFFYKNRKLFGNRAKGAINNIIFVVVFNLFLGLQLSGIDNWAHIGGLMGGLIFAWFAGPQWQVGGISPNLQVADTRGQPDTIVGLTVVTIIFGILAAIGILFPF